ncbi:hypothetical protein D3C85_1765660 [compost metagenome]
MAGAAVLGQQVFELRLALGVRCGESRGNKQEGRQAYNTAVSIHDALRGWVT